MNALNTPVCVFSALHLPVNHCLWQKCWYCRNYASILSILIINWYLCNYTNGDWHTCNISAIWDEALLTGCVPKRTSWVAQSSCPVSNINLLQQTFSGYYVSNLYTHTILQLCTLLKLKMITFYYSFLTMVPSKINQPFRSCLILC